MKGEELPARAESFHLALREAIRERGLTLERLRARLVGRGLPVALSTLSDWQHGRSRPERRQSLRVVAALEDILGMPRHSLLALLERDTEPGSRRRAGLDERARALGELLGALPGSHESDVEVVTKHQTVTLDGRRVAVSARTRVLIRATHDGVDRYFVRCFGEAGSDPERLAVRPLDYCRLGRVLRHPSEPVMVVELLFDETLARGDTWVFEWDCVDMNQTVAREFGHGFRHHVGHYLMEIRFDPAALPAGCHAYARAGLAAPARRLGDLALNAHHAVHLPVANVSSGVRGIAWEWPPEPAEPAEPVPLLPDTGARLTTGPAARGHFVKPMSS
ncbi:multiprotein-bridging factor 1 family protein [Planotetraspora sp. GP83]|uniref:helix-turn-helix domain-containing protein n=1 Tax=Planotetraspora sp. GP83 TaxID=3156264 RepID=UPI0035111FE6